MLAKLCYRNISALAAYRFLESRSWNSACCSLAGRNPYAYDATKPLGIVAAVTTIPKAIHFEEMQTKSKPPQSTKFTNTVEPPRRPFSRPVEGKLIKASMSVSIRFRR
jgi:hypothetical protein